MPVSYESATDEFNAKRTARVGGGCSCCCLCCCLICLFIFAIALGATKQELQTWEETTATIVAIKPFKVGDNNNKDEFNQQNQDDYYEFDDNFTIDDVDCVVMEIEFFAFSQVTATIPESGLCGDAKYTYEAGDTVDILFDLEDPENSVQLVDSAIRLVKFSRWMVALSTLCIFSNCLFLVWGFNKYYGPEGTTTTSPVVTATTTTTPMATVTGTPQPPVAVGTATEIAEDGLEVETPATTTTTTTTTAPIAVTTATATAYMTPVSLSQHVKSAGTFDSEKKQAIIAWMEQYYPEKMDYLTPDEIGNTLSQIASSFDQIDVVKILVSYMSGQQLPPPNNNSMITCEHVASAMNACGQFSSSTDVAKLMAPYANDPQNKQLVLELITLSFEKEDIEQLFN